MKTRGIAIALCMFLVSVFCFTSCNEVVTEIPINTEYIPAYDAMETVYEYQFDVAHGDFKLLPFYKQVHHEEVYKVQYMITYSDGTTQTEWRTVDKTEYDEAVKILRGENEE